ncbi:MAG: D-2-hydroxyacid dehydrogenase [Anaerolineales bacterium]
MNPVHVLVTHPFDESLLVRLRGVSPRVNIISKPAQTAAEIPAEIWEKIEVLYTLRALPKPQQVPALRWVQCHLAGLDHWQNEPLLNQPQVTITHLSGAAISQMAEYVLMGLLALSHRLPELLQAQARREWAQDRWTRFLPNELRDATVGIIGYGSVGRQTARLLQAFGATVLAVKRNAMQVADTGYTPQGLGDPQGDYVHRIYPVEALCSMLHQCDFVVVTVPLTPATRNLLGERELACMKPTAGIVDVSRGGIINAAALLNALKSGKLGGAVLDVFAQEPLPPESPFWSLPNVFISPHISGSSPLYNTRAADLFGENLLRYLSGLPLYNRYDPQEGY